MKGAYGRLEGRRVGFELKVLSNLIRRYFESTETKKKVDSLTGMHGWVIRYLVENRDRDVFQRDLEEQFTVRRSTATKILQLMERNGLIVRRAVDYDARLKKLELTPKAIELHQKITGEMEALENLLIQGISSEELEAFYQTIDKIKRNLESVEKK